MTIPELVRGQSTLDQLEIMQRADNSVLRRNQQGRLVGRYYGGPLNEHELKHLTLEKSHGKNRTLV